MSLTVPQPVTITPATHRFFDDLVTALSSQAALHAGYVTHIGHTAYRFLEDWPMRLCCLTQLEGNENLEIEVRPASMLTPLTERAWPTSLDLKFEIVTTQGQMPIRGANPSAPLVGIQRLNANIIEHAFIAYYERYGDNEIQKARSNAGGPPTLAFACAIRNAFAHGGVIHFTPDKAAVTVSWGGLSYSIKDNDRQVMYNDMSHGDVILLMLEMDRLF